MKKLLQILIVALLPMMAFADDKLIQATNLIIQGTSKVKILANSGSIELMTNIDGTKRGIVIDSSGTTFTGPAVLASIDTITSLASPLTFQIAGDANRLFKMSAAADDTLEFIYGDSGATATQVLNFRAGTADADDDHYVCLGGGGVCGLDARGSWIQFEGNEAGGRVFIDTGDASGADITLKTIDDFFLKTSAGTNLLAVTELGDATITGTTTTTGLNFPQANFETVAGAGTTVADAAALSTSAHIHRLTGANGTVGWKFGASVANQVEILLNTTAGVPKVYAASGGTCNGGAANAACTLLSGIVVHVCFSTGVNTWICA